MLNQVVLVGRLTRDITVNKSEKSLILSAFLSIIENRFSFVPPSISAHFSKNAFTFCISIIVFALSVAYINKEVL